MDSDYSKQTDELRKYVAPEFVYGFGARELVNQYVANFDAAHLLVVTDSGIREAGWIEPITDSLKKSGFKFTIYDAVTPNPKAHEICLGVDLYLEKKCDAIIAIGGGSPIDCAKGIGIVATNGGNVLSYEGVDNIPEPLPPLICVPTTAGTGADVSQFAIITAPQRHVKVAIISKAVVPDVSLTDPELTMTMDPELTASTGLDALTLSIEALSSNASSPITDLHAIEAARLVFAHLRDAVANGKDREARNGMMCASLQAGLAFSNASLGLAHAMAHSLGGRNDLPHGECNAILLPFVMRFNMESAADKLLRLVDWIPGITTSSSKAKTLDGLIDAVEELKRDVGAVSNLTSVGITRDDIPELAAFAGEDPCIVTNPRQANQSEIEDLYEQAL
jgi:alcohol dehydrogenase class IV